MKRKDVLREFLTTIFGSTTVKESKGKIYKSGDWFSKCEFSFNDFESYSDLLKIAYVKDKPEIQRPNFPPEDFNRINSMRRLFSYLESYNDDISFPEINDPAANDFAFSSSIELLKSIFSKSNNTDKFAVEDENISESFKEAIDNIRTARISNSLRNAISWINFEHKVFDTDYSNNMNLYNYHFRINVNDGDCDQSKQIVPILLHIYIDPSKKYSEETIFFFSDITSDFFIYSQNNKTVLKEPLSTGEFYLQKPLSLQPIKHLPIFFDYVTHIDEETIFCKYKCTNATELIRNITNKALIQYKEFISPLKQEYEKSLVNYTDDLLNRILSLDLMWLYHDSKKSLEKCRKEVEKILIGYPEVYTYIDSCSEDIVRKQLLAILHHAIVKTTMFIKENGEFISKCANNYKCESHIKYMKNKIYGNSFKELIALSNKVKTTSTDEPQSLYEHYYYTSSNELENLLNSLKSYKDYFKKSKNNM